MTRRPDHYRNWTVVAILLMGLGRGITRDVLINKVPGALTNPAFIIFALGVGTLGYFWAYDKGQLFRKGLFQFVTSFSLPFYAIVGAQAGVTAGLPIGGVLALAVIGPTAGRWYVEISSGVPPKQFVKGEWFVTTALGTGAIWLVCDAIGLGTWVCVGIAFLFGYTFRVAACTGRGRSHWPGEPAGVYRHDDGRPMLGRKLKRKSAREMHDLGLAVETVAVVPRPRARRRPLRRKAGERVTWPAVFRARQNFRENLWVCRRWVPPSACSEL